MKMEPGTLLTKSEVTKAYRKASKVYHPDKGGSDADFRRLADVRDNLYKVDGAWMFSNTWLFDSPCLMDPNVQVSETLMDLTFASREELMQCHGWTV